MTRSNLTERFWAKVDKRGPDDCWEWQGARKARGYGNLGDGPRHNHRMLLSHRYAYELEHGPIPAGHVVCHRCDNPPCCNPAHLWCGTQADNLRDMNLKGRARGNPYGSPGRIKKR